jgi:hypothetical protein
MAGARRLENEIRVGLEDSVTVVPVSHTTPEVDPLEVMSYGKTARRHVREFGSLFAIIFFAVAGWKFYRGQDLVSCSYWMVPGVVFGALGWCAPRILMPVWKGWMTFAHYLGIVMTTVLLGVTWCVGFLPMAFALRIIGIRRMDMSFRADRPTYWEPRDPKYDDFQRLKLQY